jgi:hypothetical protein
MEWESDNIFPLTSDDAVITSKDITFKSGLTALLKYPTFGMENVSLTGDWSSGSSALSSWSIKEGSDVNRRNFIVFSFANSGV